MGRTYKRRSVGSSDDDPKRKEYLDKNTEAARRCREKKLKLIEELKQKVLRLEKSNETLVEQNRKLVDFLTSNGLRPVNINAPSQQQQQQQQHASDTATQEPYPKAPKPSPERMPPPPVSQLRRRRSQMQQRFQQQTVSHHQEQISSIRGSTHQFYHPENIATGQAAQQHSSQRTIIHTMTTPLGVYLSPRAVMNEHSAGFYPHGVFHQQQQTFISTHNTSTTLNRAAGGMPQPAANPTNGGSIIADPTEQNQQSAQGVEMGWQQSGDQFPAPMPSHNIPNFSPTFSFYVHSPIIGGVISLTTPIYNPNSEYEV